jgi:hypothetical protein
VARRLERVGAEAFHGTRLLRDGTYAVAFLADWCPFCDVFLVAYESMPPPVGARLIADVTDEQSPLWDAFAIEVVPTVVVFRGGRPVARFDGVPGVGLGGRDLDRIAATIATSDGARGDSRGAPRRDPHED